ncbi:MAG: glycine zipper domain-containing protein [Pseudonocardiaceae bacterium]
MTGISGIVSDLKKFEEKYGSEAVEREGHAIMGGLIGGAAGGLTGMAIGTAVCPGIGTSVGAAVGFVVGTVKGCEDETGRDNVRSAGNAALRVFSLWNNR